MDRALATDRLRRFTATPVPLDGRRAAAVAIVVVVNSVVAADGAKASGAKPAGDKTDDGKTSSGKSSGAKPGDGKTGDAETSDGTTSDGKTDADDGEDTAAGVWLTVRAAGMRAHPGQFALPGGGVDDGEDAVAAALRELREELGITLPRHDVLGVLDDYPTRSGYVITPVVVWASTSQRPSPNPAEVAAVLRVPLRDLDVPPRFVQVPGSDKPVIQLPLLGRLVHAPTAAMLYQFREVVLHDRHTQVADLEQPPFAWQ